MPIQGDGGEGIEDPGQRTVGEAPEAFDALAGRSTMGGVLPVAGRDLADEVGGGGRTTAVGDGVRRLNLAPAVGRRNGPIDDGSLGVAQPGQGQSPEALESTNVPRKLAGAGDARQVPDIDCLTTAGGRLDNAATAGPRPAG